MAGTRGKGEIGETQKSISNVIQKGRPWNRWEDTSNLYLTIIFCNNIYNNLRVYKILKNCNAVYLEPKKVVK
jgi:hypothetical protein